MDPWQIIGWVKVLGYVLVALGIILFVGLLIRAHNWERQLAEGRRLAEEQRRTGVAGGFIDRSEK